MSHWSVLVAVSINGWYGLIKEWYLSDIAFFHLCLSLSHSWSTYESTYVHVILFIRVFEIIYMLTITNAVEWTCFSCFRFVYCVTQANWWDVFTISMFLHQTMAEHSNILRHIGPSSNRKALGSSLGWAFSIWSWGFLLPVFESPCRLRGWGGAPLPKG